MSEKPYDLNSRKDITKTENITAALIRNVAPPIKLYKTPPAIDPMILAKPPTLPATPQQLLEELFLRVLKVLT